MQLHSPMPPMDPQKQAGMTGVLVRRTRAGQPVCKTVEGAEGQPSPADGTWLLDYTGPGGPCLDHQGMVLPHSILGNLQDFKSYLETRGDTDVKRASLVRKVPEMIREDLAGVRSSAAGGQADGGAEERGCELSASQNQSRALQNWSIHMRQRQRQQDSLAKSLHRPKDWLLMNRANSFRRVQEQRELLSLVLPAIQPGHGHRVGSEFWSLPEGFGDEVSGITATLTRTQRGHRGPMVCVGQPRTIQHESGNVLSEMCGPASKAWDQSEYLRERQQQIQQVLKEFDLERPDIDRLEVIGSSKPFTPVSVHPNPLRKEEEAREKATPEKR
ncbi:unnamed protein product [Merluccius merluccius]